MSGGDLKLPIIDLLSPNRTSSANLIRQACIECGFFYLVNHGVEEELLESVFVGIKNFFSLPLEEKKKLGRKENRGYTPLYVETLDTSAGSRGDSKETFHIGPIDGDLAQKSLNQWPSEGALPFWRSTMESYYRKVLTAGKRLISLIALALNLDEGFFEKIGAFEPPNSFLRLLHYPGDLGLSDEEIYGASAHSDYGMVTLLACDGVRGLQVCRDKFQQPQKWDDVPNINGAFIVNTGDLLERWSNCLFRSTLHRVIPTGQERYSAAFFLEPNPDCVVECLRSCCSDLSPPRFSPIRAGDYMEGRLRVTYSSGG